MRFTPFEVPMDRLWTAKDDARYISSLIALPGCLRLMTTMSTGIVAPSANTNECTFVYEVLVLYSRGGIRFECG